MTANAHDLADALDGRISERAKSVALVLAAAESAELPPPAAVSFFGDGPVELMLTDVDAVHRWAAFMEVGVTTVPNLDLICHDALAVLFDMPVRVWRLASTQAAAS